MFQNPGTIDDALAATGSNYRLPPSYGGAQDATMAPPIAAQAPSQAPAAAFSPPPAEAAPAPGATAAPAGTAAPVSSDPAAPEDTKGGSTAAEKFSTVNGVGQAAAAAKAGKQNAAFQKVGALVSTVLSAYTGNAAGVAGGAASLKQSQGK